MAYFKLGRQQVGNITFHRIIVLVFEPGAKAPTELMCSIKKAILSP